jgi:DNA repair protein RecO (recombination protein O)
MIESATGLVLRTRPLTETSLIVQWLTPDLGRLATVAKGARRPKSPFRGKLDLFYLADFSFARSRRSELHTLREVNLRETHRALREELGYLQQAAYCAGLVEQTTETETPLPAVFDLMLGLLANLPAQPPQPQTVFAFELKLLEELGLRPDLEQSRLNPGTKQLLKALTASDWPMTARLRPSAAQVGELRRFLGGFLAYHLGKEVRGRDSALDGLWRARLPNLNPDRTQDQD